eukprot:8615217-Karenia_brevis.AAC.1
MSGDKVYHSCFAIAYVSRLGVAEPSTNIRLQWRYPCCFRQHAAEQRSASLAGCQTPSSISCCLVGRIGRSTLLAGVRKGWIGRASGLQQMRKAGWSGEHLSMECSYVFMSVRVGATVVGIWLWG